MKKTTQLALIGLFTGLLMSLSACQSLSESSGTSMTREVTEIRPGILHGYSSENDVFQADMRAAKAELNALRNSQ